MMLAGCSDKPTEPVEEQTVVENVKPLPMYEYTDSIVYDNRKIMAITPCTHMEIVDDELRIFPYFDYDEYISMKHIVLSGNDLYSVIRRNKKDDDNYVQKSENSFYYSNKGVTVGIYRTSADTALHIETSKLPSSYVDLVLDELNKN